MVDDVGILCPDCNDTGWLENRVEGKYPCTCMTECEPYQLLEAENKTLRGVYYAAEYVLGSYQDGTNLSESLKMLKDSMYHSEPPAPSGEASPEVLRLLKES